MTKQQLYELATKELINHSPITKVAPHSVESGLAMGIAAIGQKALVDVALIRARLFAREATGTRLDQIALDWGIPGRRGAIGSYCFVRVVATPSTQYPPNTIITGNHGINFLVTGGFIVGDSGYVYVRCSSVDAGEETNVAALSLTRIVNAPVGHISCVNEFVGSGASNQETDVVFRDRIVNYFNQSSRHTLSYLEQIAISANSNIFRLVRRGLLPNGQVAIGVITRNGSPLSQSALDAIFVACEDYLSLREQRLHVNGQAGIVFVNVQYFPVNIAFRTRLRNGANADTARQNIQRAVAQYFIPDRWEQFPIRIEWDDLLDLVKFSSPNEIEYVADQYFIPNGDIDVPFGWIPQVVSFIMMDLNGAVLSSVNGQFPTNYQYSPIVDKNFLYNIGVNTII